MSTRFCAQVVVFPLALMACSSSATTPVVPTGTGQVDGGPGGADAEAPDAGLVIGATVDAGAAVNNCTAFVDGRNDAAVRTLGWDFDIATKPVRCLEIQVGQSVTWKTGANTFHIHPLEPNAGGDPGNPVTLTSSAALPEVTFAFPMAGTFGYNCANHTTMIGAILVVP